MKLIIREYLASLKERGELDAILPDLLSQMGFNVISRPGIGTRQDGVDVAAVGALNDEKEKLYLFSLKAGDLTRTDWDTSEQALRPSLNEIIDAYIPNRIPPEHKDKDVVICIGMGGEIKENIQPKVTGYISQNTKDKVSFTVWNGDYLASLIQDNFLQEDLLPLKARSYLRKSLAMLDEPQASIKNFKRLIMALAEIEGASDKKKIMALRQMGICLWMLFSWGRDTGNLESPYQAGEFTLLYAWEIAKEFAEKNTKASKAASETFLSIFLSYHHVCNAYLGENIYPYVEMQDGISCAIRGSNHLDVNLKLFDIVGRMSLDGLWEFWTLTQLPFLSDEQKEKSAQTLHTMSESVKSLINNNPGLLLPVKEDQAIDISIALMFLSVSDDNASYILSWIQEILQRAKLTYSWNTGYPCIFDSYLDLLQHPKARTDEYRKSATAASTLYPLIALWAALLGDEKIYRVVAQFKAEELSHCEFQFWYPDDISEQHFYKNTDIHGAVLTGLCIDRPKAEFLDQVFGECEHSSAYRELSATKRGWWPLIVTACRHYRLPLPLHLMEGLYKQTLKVEEQKSSNPAVQ